MRYQFQSTFFLFLMSLCLLQTPFLIGQEAHPAAPKHSDNSQLPIESQMPSESQIPAHPHDNGSNSFLVPQVPDQQNPDLDLGEDHFMSDFIKMLSTLGLLIGLLLFVSWYLKRMVSSRVIKQNVSSNIKVLEQRQLSARSTIHIVEIEGKTLVIGESHGNICLLTELPEIEVQEAQET